MHHFWWVVQDNGQAGITLIRINTMDLDITLKNGDTEVASAKGVQIAVKGAESVSVATGATSAPITVDVMLDVAGKTFVERCTIFGGSFKTNG